MLMFLESIQENMAPMTQIMGNITLPETNIFALENDGWNTISFRGEYLQVDWCIFVCKS